jgi:hypothetical protein
MLNCAETLLRTSNTHLPTGEATDECPLLDRASQNWEMRVEGPNSFERSYTLVGFAGEHEAEAIRRLILQLMPASSV